jgi:methylthioribose-1-phosphate isomerase
MNLTAHALEWTGIGLKVLDQRLLPDTVTYQEYHDAPGIAEAIRTMQVRGAPAIGIAAAYAVALSVRQHKAQHKPDWRTHVAADIAELARTRPTAVNLCWALQTMEQALADYPAQETGQSLLARIEALAQKIHADDIAANYQMGELGAEILGAVKGVMTHCNAGALATGGYGTALGVIRSAYQRGLRTIYAGETRPWLQGARLTVWELAQDGIPSTLIADSAAAWLMAAGKIDWLIVGADRIAANGDVANKIGTYSLSVLAKQHGVKVMVVAPTTTIDDTLASGEHIVIEERSASELLPLSYQQDTSFITAWNPVFDVTPAELITALVTERGVIFNPTAEKMRGLLCA